MSSKIKEIARKKLWALSAGRCAICNNELIRCEGNSNIGQECHIISPKPNGPRYQSDLADYDNYDNFILLCANHHKEIDTNVDNYPVSKLKRIKRDHEYQIEKKLEEEKIRIDVLTKIDSGDALGNLIWGNHGCTVISNSKNSPINKIATELDELVGNMMDMQDVLQISDKLAFHQELGDYINRISKLNHGLYADTTVKKMNGVCFSSLRIIINIGNSNVLILKYRL